MDSLGDIVAVIDSTLDGVDNVDTRFNGIHDTVEIDADSQRLDTPRSDDLIKNIPL